MRHRRRARLGAAAAGALAMVTVLLGPVTNYASESVPGWVRNPWVAWSIFASLALSAVALGLLSRYLDGEAAPSGPLTHVAAATTAGLSSLRAPHVVPALVRGREPELTHLAQLLRAPADRFAVLSGVGGIGKTTVAATLCAEARSAGYTVFWVHWRDQADLAKHLTQVALACGLPVSALERANAGHENLPDVVWRQLVVARKWLLVIDDADETARIGPGTEKVRDYRGWIRPEGGGLLLVTSRDTSTDTWGPCAEVVRLGPLTVRAAAQVLLDTAPGAGTLREAEALAARLGGLPLALRSTSAYLAKPTSRFQTFMAYRSALLEDMRSLLGSADPNAADPEVARRTVRHTWELSLDQLGSEGYTLARPLLRLLALFGEAPIPLSLITTDLLRTAVRQPVDQGALDAVLAGLNRYGLLGVPDALAPHNGARTITLDPLVRQINLIALAEEAADPVRWHSAVAQSITQAVADVRATGRPGWAMARVLAPHAPLLLGGQDPPLPMRDARRTVEDLGEVLKEAGLSAERLALCQIQLTIDNRLLGPEHPDTLRSRDHLAGVLLELGDYRQAVELHRESLAVRERTLGADHPDTRAGRGNLESAVAALRQRQPPLP
ncbi:tetratricopeptide repeat protein [Streptomyces sp. DT2A-34]|uniref:tetratricopeptide repeat protein n=1 Tax=Streptomyces sp. DT2A-34 TaxID=3051182 RepID=UPI00265C267A|nr:tetratricopeptide repeat protein [Streptomyces sp. DT2A-34]MDO0912196.1 tetratricopeptide repeat protein [Streptomyces sp. DT2A-34]